MTRIVVLTTNSIRRRHLVRALQEFAPVERVLVETREPRPPFETAHPFEAVRKDHEAESWFGGKAPAFAEIADVEYFDSLNERNAVAALAAARPDAVIVFGTGKLAPAVIAVCPEGCINLHGGDPEHYRGLDVALWAVYHGDFGALSATVQRLAPELDSGDIVARSSVTVTPGMGLHELRRAGTETSIGLLRDALDGFARTGGFGGTPMARKGRYYSFMPAVLKNSCVDRWQRHTALLASAA